MKDEKPLRNCDRDLASNLLSAICLYCIEKQIDVPFMEWNVLQHTEFLKWLFKRIDDEQT